jgi:rhamnogalacturonan hydrolase
VISRAPHLAKFFKLLPKMLTMLLRFLPILIALAVCSDAQLVGTTGPTTSLSTKSKVCNILSYGAKADGKTDIGPAILSAFTNCAKAGGATIYIPPGNYAQSTWITLSGGSHYAFQLDGIIRRTGTAGGHMIIFSGATDLEVFSKTSKGAVQGAGYEMHKGVKGQYGYV